jgi:hypothetical protein
MRRFLILFALVLISGCSVPLQIPAFFATPTLMATDTFVPEETGTPDPSGFNCAYVWSARDLPDVAREVTSAFRAQGMPEVEVQASAYGEDCIEPVTNEVVGFSTMQTDLYFAVVVPDTSNTQLMGEWIEKIYQVLEMFPPDVLPGANPGYIEITFSSGVEPVNLWFYRPDGERALSEGLRASDLFDALAAR